MSLKALIEALSGFWASLSRVDLRWTSFSGAVFRGAFLRGANLSKADLSEVNLKRALLSEADLSEANLIGADLVEANLIGTKLSGADLNRADFKGATVRNTVFANVDLSQARSLDLVNHLGPSSIGIDTLLLSGGSIPDSFLEGCGVPDLLIDYLPSLLGEPISYYSSFISYSHKDEDFCKHLHSRMRADKLRVWYAPEDVQGGKKIYDQIDTAIKRHDKLLIILSEHSMKSEWVKTEIRKARNREVEEGRQVLFPIRLVPFEAIRDWKAFNADIGKDIAVEIREYHIPDFTNWKDHDSFEKAYQRLMKDFKPTPD